MQQHGSKYFVCGAPHPHPLTLGSKGQNLTFPEHGQIAYQIKYNHQCRNVVAYILPAYPLLPPPNPGGGVKMSKLTFSKHGHVAYQLKWNHKCSHMVANISPRRPPRALGVKRLKLNFFRTLPCCISKGIANAAT